jgi:hypothetical protein
VRGKKKYIYEFSITVGWEIELREGGGGRGDKNAATTTMRCRGVMTFPDVDGAMETGGVQYCELLGRRDHVLSSSRTATRWVPMLTNRRPQPHPSLTIIALYYNTHYTSFILC